MTNFIKATSVLGVMLMSFFGPAYACDVCNIFEYSTVQNRSFAGFFYRYRVFNGYDAMNKSGSFFPRSQSMDAGFGSGSYESQGGFDFGLGDFMHEPEGDNFFVEKTDRDYETYQSFEFRAQFSVADSWNVILSLPYEWNRVHYDRVVDFPNPINDTTMNIAGWGDALVIVDRMIRKDREDGGFHIFRPGIGVQLPTGAYRETAFGAEMPYHPIVQPGSASWGLMTRLGYQFFDKYNGINFFVNRMDFNAGANDYRHGRVYNAFAEYYRQFTLGVETYLIPKIGGYVETAQKDVWEGEKDLLTGGTSAFATIGLDFGFYRYNFFSQFQLPVWEQLNGNQIANAGRLNMGVMVLIGS
ncbi:MAG: hypothetical protein LAT68_14790 [Cyclobacteriaceae bacterium]|nr:hypothetical protein [Cyclobacteriaceae bacterium]MCH8517587.1 hypothetical protein [Cyclobacteriaceae bacterium]